MLGIARTIRSELMLEFATLEVDTVDSRALEALCGVFTKFQRRFKGSDQDPDWEFALFEETVQIPRCHWAPISRPPRVISEKSVPGILETETFELLQTLRWVQSRPIPLSKDQVEVKPRAVGLNFKVNSLCT